MVEQKKLKLKLVLPLTQELWYPGARVLVASSRRHSVLGKLPDKYATSLCTGSKASLVMSAFWCFLGPFSCSLISIFRKLQDSNLLVRYTPPPQVVRGCRERRQGNELEGDSHSRPTFFWELEKSVSFMVREWVMTPSDTVSGQEKFTGCRVGALILKDPGCWLHLCPWRDFFLLL